MLAKTSEDGRQWFVLTCEPNREKVAASHLIARRFKVYLPEISTTATRGVRRAKMLVSRPMFRGYLFIRLGREDRWTWVETAPGVLRFLRLEDDFAVISDQEMQRVYDVEQGEIRIKKERKYLHEFEVNEPVRVAAGLFSGLNGRIETLDDEERITILLSMLGRATPVQLSSFDLEKL